MSKRAILGFINSLQALRNLGADLSGLERNYGLVLEHLSPDGEIERALELRLFSDVLPSVNDELAGLKIGATMSLAGYGPLVMLLLTCRTVWEALQTGIRYQTLTYLFGELRLDVGERESALCLRPAMLPPVCRRFLIDRDISGTYQLVRDLQNSLGLNLQPLRIHLPYPRPRDVRPYEERFQCPVEFGSDETVALFATERLAQPFPAPNRTAHTLYQQQCDALILQRAQNTGDLGRQVKDYLDLFSDGFPTVQAVAATFGLPERSFRRRLSEEATRFRTLLDQVRLDKARHLLQETRLPVETIAQRLGYAESAAFIHAFQRWTGQTPAAFRGRQAG